MATFSNQFIRALANPTYSAALGRVAENIAAQPRRRRRQGMLTELLGPALDPRATTEQLRQSAAQALNIGETDLAVQLRGMASQAAQRQAAKNIETGKGELLTLANDPSFTLNDQATRQKYFAIADQYGVPKADAVQFAVEARSRREKTPQKLGPGDILVEPSTGREIARGLPTEKGGSEVIKIGNVGVDLPLYRKLQAEGGDVSKAFIVPPDSGDGKSAFELLDKDNLREIFTDESIAQAAISGDDSKLIPRQRSRSEEASAAIILGNTAPKLATVNEALSLLEESKLDLADAGGISGAGGALVPGTKAHQLASSLYVTIAGQEALDEITRMKEEAAKSGSRGTGLGQVTQIEFAALQGNLAKLNTGLPVDVQIELLNKIKQRMINVRRIASGESPIDVIDFNNPIYAGTEETGGYIKDDEGDVFYFAPNGDTRIYDRNKDRFVPVETLNPRGNK
jgi:hypothetical protein